MLHTPLRKLITYLPAACALVVSTFVPIICPAQQQCVFNIAELNCENLFDTVHAEGKNDNEFLPQSTKRWDRTRYHRKLQMLARELASISAPTPPDIIALTEIENDTTLRDLTQRTLLHGLGYSYLSTSGHDPRGINTAIIYLKGSFLPIGWHAIDWQERRISSYSTRQSLHVTGITRMGDTLDIIAVHLPSKMGGRPAKVSREKILYAMRTYCHSILANRPNANIIIIGDFNDEPRSRAIIKRLQAVPLHRNANLERINICKQQLYNISWGCRGSNGALGTYRYRGHWQMIDQCIVSGRLLHPSSPLSTSPAMLKVIDSPFLMEKESTYGGNKPWRTYQGTLYKGGFSDHLPLLLQLISTHQTKQHSSSPHNPNTPSKLMP